MANGIEAPPLDVERSPTDILRLAVAMAVFVGLVLVGMLFDDAIVGFASDLLRGLDALPQWLVKVVGIGIRLLALVVVIGGLAVTVLKRRMRLLASIVLGVVIGLALFFITDPLVDHTEAALAPLDDVWGPVSDAGFPGAGVVAAVAAGVTATAPWTQRRWRRAGWALVIGVATARFVVAPVSFDTAFALAAGWVGGAAAVVALGAPSLRPTPEQVAAGLAAVGVPLASLEKAGVDARGSTPYFGETTDGRKLFVKALGDDERSADLLFRLYRRIQPRDLGDEKPFSTLRRAVEHEALVALAARDIGIRTPRLVAFATAEPGACVLAYEAIAGRSFDRLELDEVTDDILDAVWATLGQMRAHRIAHRDLRLANIFLADDGEVWAIDFGFSELAGSDLLLATDLAELLASSSVQVGVERAVAAGRRSVDAHTLTTALERLDVRYLSGATRAGMKADPSLMPALRAALGGA